MTYTREELNEIVARKERLATNSGTDVDELTLAPVLITPNLVDVDDGGQAIAIHIAPADGDSVFVELRSWNPAMEHDLIRAFIGKRVEVTIKVVE